MVQPDGKVIGIEHLPELSALSTKNLLKDPENRKLIDEGKKTSRLLRWNDDYDFLDNVTLLECFECVEKNGSASQLQELLGPLASHPRALPGGGYDCDIHKKVTGNK